MSRHKIRLAVGLFLGGHQDQVNRWVSPGGQPQRRCGRELPPAMKDPFEDYGTSHAAYMKLDWAQREVAIGNLYRDTEIMEKDYELDLPPAVVAASLLAATSEQLTVAVMKAAGLWKGEDDGQQ